MDSLVEYLGSKGIRTWPAAGHEVTAHCPFACPPDKAAKGRGKLYLNTETWLYDCKVCGTQGGRKSLLEHFGDEEDATYLPGANPSVRLALLSQYADHAAELLAGNDEKVLWLLRRGLNAETIMAARLGFVPKGYGICHSLPGDYSPSDLARSGMLTERGSEFHAGHLVIPYTQRDKVLQIRGKDIGGRYYTPAGEQVRLYNADSLRGAEYVIITEGEFDTLILAQHLRQALSPRYRSIAVVALPGAGAWPGGKEGFADYFREAKRVYIGLDPDETGIRETHKLKEALGSKARVILLPQDDSVRDSDGRPVKCDWTEYLRDKDGDHPWGGHTVADVQVLIDVAEMTGKRIFSVAEAASKWRSDKIERPGIKLGFPALDAVIAPGLRPGNLCIPLAKTGTGKTVFLANILYNTRDRRVLHITLENTVTELFELLWRIYHFWNPTAEEFHIERDMPYLRIVDENRLSYSEFGMLIEEYTAEVGDPPELVNIDYLGYLAAGQRGSGRYEKVSSAVMEVKGMAKMADCAVITPHQVSRGLKEGSAFEGDEARDSGVVEETADFMFGLYRPSEAIDRARQLRPGSVTHELNAQIIKSRRGGKGKIAELAMSSASLVIADAMDNVALQRIQQENAGHNRGLRYEDIAKEVRNVALSRAQMRLV